MTGYPIFEPVPEITDGADFDQWFDKVDRREYPVFKLSVKAMTEILGTDSVALANQFEVSQHPVDIPVLKSGKIVEAFGDVCHINSTGIETDSFWHTDEGDAVLHLQGEVGDEGFRPVIFTLVSGWFKENRCIWPDPDIIVDNIFYFGTTAKGEGLCFYGEGGGESGEIPLLAHWFGGSGIWAILDSDAI